MSSPNLVFILCLDCSCLDTFSTLFLKLHCSFWCIPVNPNRQSAVKIGYNCSLHCPRSQREIVHLHKQRSGAAGEEWVPSTPFVQIFILVSEKLTNATSMHHVTVTFLLQRPLKEQQGPEQGTSNILEQMGSKDLATELTNYDWELFTALHEVILWL